MTSSVSLPGGLELSPGNYRTRRGSTDNLQNISLSAWEWPSINSLDLQAPSSEANEPQTLSAQQIAQAMLSPVDCAEVLSGGWYKRAPHLELLNEYLLKCERGEITRLMVFMPPQHSKSETVSHFLPCWILGRHPEARIGLASYGQSWAEHWGREVRDTMREYGQQVWGLSVREDTSSVSDWRLQGQRGGMVSVGVRAGLTGRGLEWLIIDDPVKDDEEAYSEVKQEGNWNWYQSVARTRLSAAAVQILMMTRWHEADLAGKILEAEAHGWTVLRLPALAERSDPLGREEGEPLWPAIGKDRAWLEEVRYGPVNPETNRREGGITEYWFSALYQQHPSPESGLLFQRSWWQYYESPPDGSDQGIYPGGIFVDAAFTEETYSDYTVLAPVIRVVRDLYWLGLRRGRWAAAQFVEQCIIAQEEYRLPLFVEETTSSRSLIQMLKSKGLTVIAVPVLGKSKRNRAEAASPYVAAGQCYLPHESWAKGFIEEHAQFPHGAHDDQVDTTSAAIMRLLVERIGERQESVSLNWEVR